MPFRLKANDGKSFQGSIVLGMGFVMTPEAAEALIARDARNHDVLYRPADSASALDDVGRRYDEHRRSIMSTRREGLTKTYNRFHDPDQRPADIIRLRELHVEMDHAVAAAYGWSDLVLDHGFHETKQGLRFTVSPHARQEILDRLLELNHQRYAEEEAGSLHRPKGTRRPGNERPARKRGVADGGLF